MLTTTTTTTVEALSQVSQAEVFGAISVVVLIALLIAKELLSASENKKALLLGRVIGVAIYPLLVVFLTIVAVQVIAVVG